MKILLDESVPHFVKTDLSSFPIWTMQELGWSGIKNGELLARAARDFTLLVTADRNLRYQQRIPAQLAVLVLPTNRARLIRAILPEIARAFERLRPGDILEMSLPTP